MNITKMEFTQINSLYYSLPTLSGIEKVASFDMDGTLIKTKSGFAFASNKDDWEFLFENTVQKLKELNDQGYTIVIFTNQAGVTKNKLNINDITVKINNIRKNFNFDINVFIATDDDYYRKPMTGMWDFFCSQTGIKSINDNSFYCGDAAGRVYGKNKKDFSTSDLYFAHNINIKFITPEELFNHPILCKQLEITDNININQYFNNTLPNIEKGNDQEMIILVGRPASGKSFFAKKYYDDYVYVNQDTLKTKAKCKKVVNESVSNGKNIIIDNTNGTKQTRKEFINMANKHNIIVKIYVFDVPLELSKHLNYVRTQILTGKIKLIPKIVYNIYEKKYEEPTDNEGIIIHVPFVPNIKEENLVAFYYKYN